MFLIAICGKGMGALAGLLKDEGFHVSGSDENAFPPMSTFLHEKGILLIPSYAPDQLPRDIDLVIVGNACRKDHPQVLETIRRGLPIRSFPQTMGETFLSKQKSVVIAGTHGKTTTTAMVSYLLKEAGGDPSWLVGGVPRDLDNPAHLGRGKFFVIEGDEYDSVFYDKVPKFFHYRPHHVLLTSVEFDHADIFPDLAAVKAAFAHFCTLIPSQGHLLAWGGSRSVEEVVKGAKCSVLFYGIKGDCPAEKLGWWAEDIVMSESGSTFRLKSSQKDFGVFETQLTGDHNLRNWVATLAELHLASVNLESVRPFVKSFQGVKGRQEVEGSVDDIVVINDFAHHPTAVLETLKGIRARYPKRRIWGVFEPRTQTSCRRVFQKEYEQAFLFADIAVISQPGRKLSLPESEIFKSSELVEGIRHRGQKAILGESIEQMVELFGKEARQGDVIVFMSNGDFGGIHRKVLSCLQKRVLGPNSARS